MRTVLLEMAEGPSRRRYVDLLWSAGALFGILFPPRSGEYSTRALRSAFSRYWLGGLIASSLVADAFGSGPETGEWLIQTWETEDGLPENSATAMAQTPDGYLWFGTFKGLVRFDGVHFRTYDRSNTPELPSEGIVNLHLDKTGRLWVSTLAGLAVRDGLNWHAITGPDTPKDDYIRTFTERGRGELLLTTFQGRVLEFANGRLRQLPAPPGAAGSGYLGGVDEEGKWWVAQHKFIGRWNHELWEPMVSGQALEKAGAGTLGLSPARNGGFWLLLGLELRKYSHGAEVARRTLHESPGAPWSMTEDSHGDVWLCTFDRGICQVSPDEKMVRWNEENGLSYHGTRFVFEDRESNLWVGTSGGGLQRFKQRRFQNFGVQSGIAERVVKSVSPAPEGGLWITTYGKGLFRWTEAGITNVPLAGWSNGNLYAQSVLADRRGRTWVGTFGEALFMFDTNGTRRFPPAQTGGNGIVALFEDSHGRVWVSGGEGISVFDGGTFRPYGRDRDPAVKGVCCFGQDSAGSVWFSNMEKVYRLEQDQFIEVTAGSGNALRGITCLKGAPDGVMWMGSMGAGLLRWRHGDLARIGAEAGLPAASIYGIVEDNQGFWWMPSNRGVARLKKSELQSVADGTSNKLTCQLLDMSDGLGAVECTRWLQPVCAQDTKGRLWFATIKGVAMTEPDRFRANSVAPQTIIEEVVYHLPARRGRAKQGVEGRVEGRSLTRLELPAGSRGLEIHYTAPSFASPEKERFQISLDGIIQDWQDAGNRRVAFFNELQPGPHAFRVRASNDDGMWDETGATLAFTVLPFFWQTAQFRVLLVAGFCGGAMVWGYRLMRRLERKRAMQEAFTRQLILSQENERKRVASDLHDGLGQDLLVLKNRLGLLAANSKQSPELARKLTEITADASRAINEVREISQALRPTALEQVGFTQAVEWMVEQLGKTTPQTKFSTELHDIDGLLPPDQEISLYRIIQEGLSNATRHAQASRVIVEVRHDSGRLRVSLFDDGQGFEPKNTNGNGHGRPGFGLAGMRERAKVLGGRIEIQSERGKGTRLTLSAPLPKSQHD